MIFNTVFLFVFKITCNFIYFVGGAVGFFNAFSTQLSQLMCSRGTNVEKKFKILRYIADILDPTESAHRIIDDRIEKSIK